MMRITVFILLLCTSVAAMGQRLIKDEGEIVELKYPELEIRDSALCKTMHDVISKKELDTRSVDDDYVMIFPTKSEFKKGCDTIITVLVVIDPYDVIKNDLKRAKEIKGSFWIHRINKSVSYDRSRAHRVIPIGDYSAFISPAAGGKTVSYFYSTNPIFNLIVYEGWQLKIRKINGGWEVVPGSEDWY